MLIMRLLNLLAGELLPPEDETGEVLQHFQELLFPTFTTFQVCRLWAGQFCVAAPKSSTCLHRSLAVQESTPPMTAMPIDQGAASLLPSLWVPEEHAPALLPGAFQAGLEWMRMVWSPTKTPSITELWSGRKRQVLDVVPMPDHSWSRHLQNSPNISRWFDLVAGMVGMQRLKEGWPCHRVMKRPSIARTLQPMAIFMGSWMWAWFPLAGCGHKNCLATYLSHLLTLFEYSLHKKGWNHLEHLNWTFWNPFWFRSCPESSAGHGRKARQEKQGGRRAAFATEDSQFAERGSCCDVMKSYE